MNTGLHLGDAGRPDELAFLPSAGKDPRDAVNGWRTFNLIAPHWEVFAKAVIRPFKGLLVQEMTRTQFGGLQLRGTREGITTAMEIRRRFRVVRRRKHLRLIAVFLFDMENR